MEHADIAIIGAGPAGLATAIHLGQLGVGRVVLLDRQDFPRDKTCGSGVSPKGVEVLKILGVGEAVAAEAYMIRGLRLVTPRGHDAVLSGHTDAALICCRRILDHLLLQRALTLGARFLPRFDARFLLQQGDRVMGCRAADGREVRAKLTVIADGAHSRLAPERGPRRLIQAIMGWWDRVPFRPQHIEMVFDRLVSPYYGWLFPEGPSRVNIGICYSDPGLEKNARALFQAFLDKHYARRLSGAQPSGGWRGHPISYSARIEKLTSPGRITVGEAGRLTHPATAEGIYQAMSSGMRAAEALRDILTGDVTEDVSMRRYEAACRGAFARSFAGAALWRGLVASGGLDIVGGALALPPMQRLLARGLAQM